MRYKIARAYLSARTLEASGLMYRSGNMLRRAENVSVSFARSWPGSKKGRMIIHIGKTTFRSNRNDQANFDESQKIQRHEPLQLLTHGDRTYWQFQDRFYWEDDHLTDADVYALLITRQQRERQRIDRARAMVAMGEEPRTAARRHISDDVKQLVWQRDRGRCRRCGAVTELQYDHIIPVAMGGASTAENLQILCGPCNRRKAAGLTTY
ncbi:HNH endonuclease signature motif containing protein [Streptomyces misionensis]|uniref:HNH endonuclease n=1 Tax=Streptomyces misionensis TaxID=67331 RepID=UPI0033C20D7A